MQHHPDKSDLAGHSSFNAPHRSKMKLWKRVIFAFVLFSVALLLLLTIIMIPAKSTSHWASLVFVHPSSTASSLSQSPPTTSTSSPRMMGLQQMVRTTDGMGSTLSEFSYLFQNFTERELQKVIKSLVDTKIKRRTKRAKKGPNECSLQEVVLTVSELGLGYESDETVNFRYCSGKCTVHRRNYDMVIEHMRLNEASNKGCPSNRDRTKKHRARYGACCRPTKYEKKMSFFDNNDKFSTIWNVSAKECGCI